MLCCVSLCVCVCVSVSHAVFPQDFVAALPGNEDIKKLKADVEHFALKFPMPGV